MTPDPLAPLLAPIDSLPGFAEPVPKLLAKAAGGARLLDLLLHVPHAVIDRRDRASIKDAKPGGIVTWEVEIVTHLAPATRRQPWKVVITDGTAFAELVFFSPARLRMCVPGSKVLVSGKLEAFEGRLTMPHPDHLVPVGRGEVPLLEPAWGLTAGLWPRQIARAMKLALTRLPELPEWHDAALLRREKWPAFSAALTSMHAPTGPADLEPHARRRLAYDELLAHQLSLQWLRARIRARPGRPLLGDGRLRAEALRRFGHRPTPSQAEAVAEIDADLAAPSRMLRLLQGDVGSGKTLVALLAMLRAAEAGCQAALMAPTATLASQHFQTIGRLSPVPVVLLTGAVKGAERTAALAAIANGEARLIIGTHALFQRGVEYADLALAVIDEQHRFGVDQRLLMGGKGAATDVLVMTATPIPRTMLLARWGEMDVSTLKGKPAGRLPIRTSVHPISAMPDLIAGIERALSQGGQTYWVCPLREESEQLDLAAALDRFAALRAHFGEIVGVAHGTQPPPERAAALADFASGRTRILVATTVIEVGVDVPGANVMVIEHAERFGLAQLHQLRGRVGRGAAQSFCLLLHAEGIGKSAEDRLRTLRETEDGFRIAETDFRLRGGGDMLGTRQSGLPDYRVADLTMDEDLFHMAAQDAALIIQRDPSLTNDRGKSLRLLLRVFDRVAAMRTLRAG